MKTIFYRTASIFIGLVLLSILSCSKENSEGPLTAYQVPNGAIHEIQNIPAGIYKGAATHLQHGVAYSWLEFKAVDDLDNVGIVLPISELINSSSPSIEISLPNANQYKDIFNKIFVNSNSMDPISGMPGSAHISFNFYLNESLFNSSEDCNMHHAWTNMPAGYSPILTPGGNINGLDQLWQPVIETNESRQIELLLGSSHASLAFYSPTVSTEVLLNHPDFIGEIPLPPTMTPFRYYPTAYHIKQVDNDLIVKLEKFVLKN